MADQARRRSAGHDVDDAASLVLANPAVEEVATAVGCTAGQAVLMWGVQRGHTVIPKSFASAPHTHLRENLAAAAATFAATDGERSNGAAADGERSTNGVAATDRGRPTDAPANGEDRSIDAPANAGERSIGVVVGREVGELSEEQMAQLSGLGRGLRATALCLLRAIDSHSHTTPSIHPCFGYIRQICSPE